MWHHCHCHCWHWHLTPTLLSRKIRQTTNDDVGRGFPAPGGHSQFNLESSLIDKTA